MLKVACVLLGILFPLVGTADTVTITSPSPTAGQVITNGCIHVFAVAQSDVGASIKSWHIYIDHKNSGFRANNTRRINARVCVPAVNIGNHLVKVTAWSTNEVAGSSAVVNVTISGDYKIVAPADEALSPATGQSFNNGLIRISTGAYSPYPLTKWIVYIDGKNAFTSYEGAIQVKTDLEVPLGTHRVTVHIWDVNQVMASYTATNVHVTKDPMNIQRFVTPPSSAVTMRNFDDKGILSWHSPKTGGTASCRGADLVCIAMAPVAVAKPIQFVATPLPLPVASDGMVALVQTLPGTEPYGNALWGSSIFVKGVSRTNYIVDLWVMPTSTNVQSLEIDLWTTVNKVNFMMGTQCNFAGGHWDFWDDTPAVPPAHPHWQKIFPTPQNNDLVCDLKPNQWAHLRYNMAHDATSYHFVSIEVDGVNHPLSELPASLPSPRPWKDNGTAIQIQLDSNASATPFQVYIDNFNLTEW